MLRASGHEAASPYTRRIFTNRDLDFDKIDVVDMMQQVVSGLVIDVNAQIRIRRDEDGKLATEVSKKKVTLANEDEPTDEDE